MNKFRIMFLSLILLVFAIGVVSAPITDYNAPAGFERNPVTFSNDDFKMELESYESSADYDDYFKNSEDRKVETINGTYAKYTDSFKEEVGALELLEIDDEQYVVSCTFDGLEKSKTKDCLKYLEEFNEVNKFKPIKIEWNSKQYGGVKMMLNQSF